MMFIYTDIALQFRCRMCGTCCRNDWQVTLDEESYRRNFRLFAEKHAVEEFEQAFVRLSAADGVGEYAYIAKKVGGCWFLDEQNLCCLQKEAGHEHLDAVCRLFPRYPMNTARGVELTLSFCCPAVLDLVERSQPIQILRLHEEPLSVAANQCATAVFPKQHRSTALLHYYFELEQHFIDIMQCRRMDMDARLRLLQQTIHSLSACGGNDDVGRDISRLCNANYDYFESLPVHANQAEAFSGEFLLEHYFVNFIFKKPFYMYGFAATIQLIDAVWRKVKQILHDDADDVRYKKIRSVVMTTEFQYSHNRRALMQLSKLPGVFE